MICHPVHRTRASRRNVSQETANLLFSEHFPYLGAMLKPDTGAAPKAEREGLDRREFLKEPKGAGLAPKNCEKESIWPSIFKVKDSHNLRRYLRLTMSILLIGYGFILLDIKGDKSGCGEPHIDLKTKVPFWPVLAWPAQNGTLALMSMGGSPQPDVSSFINCVRSWPRCERPGINLSHS